MDGREVMTGALLMSSVAFVAVIPGTAVTRLGSPDDSLLSPPPSFCLAFHAFRSTQAFRRFAMCSGIPLMATHVVMDEGRLTPGFS